MGTTKTNIIIALNIVILLGVIELASYGVLSLIGVDAPLFINKHTIVKGEQSGDTFNTLDPQLGYAHGINEQRVKNLSDQFTWLDGFVIYEEEKKDIKHPVVLALGGSTTDGVQYGHSWPEELSKILKQNGITGTVINGGTGGYSTNQELFKLVRDGLEFNPDIVISYAGINDRGKYSKLPYPMVHKYQRKLLETIVKSSQPKYLVSTRTLLKRLTGTQSAYDIRHTLGVKSQRTLAEQYKKNIELMNAISKSQGADFFAFIQPFAFYKSIHGDNPIRHSDEEYKATVLALYDQISLLPEKLHYVHDATHILEQHSDVYESNSSVHLSGKGDKVVANYIYSQIEPVLKNFQEPN
jgi:lysophospholipase L1-like esterase